MRWDTRIAILAGLLCLITAAWYFQVFQPGQPHLVTAIDFTQPPAEPEDLSFDDWLNPGSADETPAQLPPPKQEQPPGPMALPSSTKLKPIQVPPPPAKPPAPETVVQPPKPKPSPPKTQPRYYTVQSGDSLWKIARDQLGDSARHLELFELNESILHGDPDSLSPGQKLILPPK